MTVIFSKMSFFSKVYRAAILSASRCLFKASEPPTQTVTERWRIKSNDFGPASLYQLDRAHCLTPTRFTVSSLIKMKETDDRERHLHTLREELLVRLAHLQMFLFSVENPIRAPETLREVLLLQGQSFREVLRLVTRETSGIYSYNVYYYIFYKTYNDRECAVGLPEQGGGQTGNDGGVGGAGHCQGGTAGYVPGVEGRLDILTTSLQPTNTKKIPLTASLNVQL